MSKSIVSLLQSDNSSNRHLSLRPGLGAKRCFAPEVVSRDHALISFVPTDIYRKKNSSFPSLLLLGELFVHSSTIIIRVEEYQANGIAFVRTNDVIQPSVLWNDATRYLASYFLGSELPPALRKFRAVFC